MLELIENFYPSPSITVKRLISSYAKLHRSLETESFSVGNYITEIKCLELMYSDINKGNKTWISVTKVIEPLVTVGVVYLYFLAVLALLEGPEIMSGADLRFKLEEEEAFEDGDEAVVASAAKTVSI
jgi:hypothetical protein